MIQKLSGDPNPQYFLKSTAVQNGMRTAVQMGGVQMGGVLLGSLSSRLGSQGGAAIQMGDVLPYKLEVYCRTFSETSGGWVSETLLNDAQ